MWKTAYSTCGKNIENKKTFSTFFPSGSVDQAVSHISTWPAAITSKLLFIFLKKEKKRHLVYAIQGGEKS